MALGFLVSALLGPIVSSPAVWRLMPGRGVYVSVDGQSRSYTAAQRTVADVLRAGKIGLAPEDRVTPALDTRVWAGIQITVVRAVPITLAAAGTRRHARVAAATVGEALALLDYDVRPEDRVSPALSAAIAPGTEITVERRETRTWVEREPIPFAVTTVSDRTVLKGQQVVRSAGQPGLLDRTVEASFVDGRSVARQTLVEAVIRPAVARIVAVGVKPRVATEGPYAGKEFLYLEATAYYPGPNNFGGGVGPRTAIGLLARRGVVAVDPSVIKLGSRVYVAGYGEAVAGDTGGAIRGSRIDLCFDTYDQAMRFGRRSVKVFLLKAP